MPDEIIAPEAQPTPIPAAPVTRRRFGDIPALRTAIYDSVLGSASGLEPVKNTRFTLSLHQPSYEGPEEHSLAKQKEVLLSGRTLARRLTGTWRLTDNATGKIVDEKKATLAQVPHLNQRGTFIINGSDFVLASQSRLRPGIYTRRQANGAVESHAAVAGKGASHRYFLEPETGLFKVKVGQAEVPLIPLMRALGATDNDLKEAWGRELFAKNKTLDSDHHLERLFDKFIRKPPEGEQTTGTRREALAKAMSAMSLDPDVMRSTLGKPFNHIDKDVLLAVSRKLLDVNRGRAEPDDREHQAYQHVLGPEDLLAERILRDKGMLQKSLWQATFNGNLSKMPPGLFNRSIMNVFMTSGLGAAPEGVGAAEYVDHGSRITRLGEGGLSAEAIPSESTAVHPSQLGFIDVVKSPESEAAGVDSRVAFGVQKGSDGRLYAPFRDPHSNHIVYKSPQEIAHLVVAFPGELSKNTTHVAALDNGHITYVPRHKVSLELPSMEQTFSPLTNLVPMKSALKAQRGSMGSRFIAQALPLENAESPFVRSGVPGQPGKSFEELYGHHAGAVFADQGGIVHKVTPTGIVVKHDDGTKKEYELYSHQPQNRKTGDNNTPLVRPGSRVSPGQILAKSDYTDDKGHLAHGLNARVAYVPALGKVYEDSGLISESFAKRMCFDSETEALTNRGWVRGDQLTLQDEIACLDNGRLVYEHPSAMHRYTSDKMVMGSGTQFDICVTPEHQLYVRSRRRPCYRKVAASEIVGHNYRLLRTAENIQPDQEYFSLPLVMRVAGGSQPERPLPILKLPMDSWCLLFGLYIAEGHTCVNVSSHHTTYIDTHKSRVRDELVRLSSEIGMGKFYEQGKHKRWYCNNKQLTIYLRSFGKSYQKYLPDWVWLLSQHQAGLVLRGILLGDAGFGAVDGGLLATTSTRLRDDVQRLALHAGLTANVRPGLKAGNTSYRADGHPITSRHDLWHVSILLHNHAPQLYSTTRGQLLQYVHLSDPIPVWCVTTRTGVIYVRRGGKSRWCGNSSIHYYQNKQDWEDTHRRGKSAFVSLFPGKYSRKILENFTADGVIKLGTTVNADDPLILVAQERERDHAQVGRSSKMNFADKSVTWEHHGPGIVTDVVHGRNGTNVVVRAVQEMKTGDKLSSRFGSKSVIHVAPDHEMPHDEEGKPYDLAWSPLQIVSRINPSMWIESALGKVAQKTGQPYVIHDWDSNRNLTQFALDELKKHGLQDTETITDPVTGRKIPDVKTGVNFIMKLHHQSEQKASGRGLGSYDPSGAPQKGSSGGALRLSLADSQAILAHGGQSVLRDAHLTRGTRNDDFWVAYTAGFPPPQTKVPPQYEKFLSSLTASGIKVKRDGPRLQLMALTDKDVKELAGNREVLNGDLVKWGEGLEAIKGGLFDPSITGGHGSSIWSKITLHEPVINPAFEDPARRLLGLTEKKFRAILAGYEELNGKTGPTAIEQSLKAINVPAEIAAARVAIASGRKGARDEASRRLQYLKAAESTGRHPGEWVLNAVPVLPSLFRPVSLMAGGRGQLVADPNLLYREVIEANENLKSLKGKVADIGAERLALYDAFKAVTGLGSPTSPKNIERGVKGILETILGSSSKFSMIQQKLLGTTVDLSGRAVIVPDPDMDMDHVGLPESKAWSVFQPFIIRHLVRRGMPRIEAMQSVKDQTKQARDALVDVMKVRPVIVNRYPILHRYNDMAFFPKLVSDDTIHLTPIVTAGFNADFDGDQQIGLVILALEKSKSNLLRLSCPNRNHWEDSLVANYFMTDAAFYSNYDFHILNLADVPHGDSVAINGNATVYSVPAGVSVVSYDDKLNIPRLSPVSHWSVHTGRKVVLVNLRSGRQIVTDDDPRAVYGMDTETYKMVRRRPSEAVGLFVPRIDKLPELFTDCIKDIKGGEGRRALTTIKLTRRFGRLVGIFAGNGWVSRGDQCNIACTDPGVEARYRDLLTEVMIDPPTVTVSARAADDAGGYGYSQRLTVSSCEFSEILGRLVNVGTGHTARDKRLPSFMLSAPREFRLGVLEGLIDTDGSISVSHGKDRGQLMASFSSSSIRLIQEVQHLLRGLGAYSRITTSKTPAGEPFWMLNISTIDIIDLNLDLSHTTKKSSLATAPMPRKDSPAATKMDQIPFPVQFRVEAMHCCKSNASLYTSINRIHKIKLLSRMMSIKAIEMVGNRIMDPAWNMFIKMVDDISTRWDTVESYEETGRVETGYDLTVPGCETFMSIDGVVLSNTSQFHVPVSDEAVKDTIDKMLPSKNLFSAASFRVHQIPSMEFLQGLHAASLVKNEGRSKVFRNRKDAIAAYKRGEIPLGQQVETLED